MFKAITPKFINKLDDYLLVNHPVVWISKIHYVLWHGIVLWALSALLGAIMPINLKTRIDYELWYFLFTVVAVIVFCFWVYNYAIFNKEKKFGNRSFTDEYKNFFLVFASVFVFASAPWPFEILYSQRVASVVDDSQFIEDMNVLNENEPYMVSSYSGFYSWQDSITHEQYFNIRYLGPYAGGSFTPYSIRLDSVRFPQMKTSAQIVAAYKPITDSEKLLARIESYMAVASKYNMHIDIGAKNIANKYLELLNKGKLTSQDFYEYEYYSHQYELTTTFNNIGEAKFKTLFIFTSDYLWALFYVVITLSAFLMLFKMTYWQQFLITIVAMALYPLLVFILSQLSPYGTILRGDEFVMASILLAIFYSGGTLFNTAFGNKYYRPFYNITNQIFYLTLVSWPILLIVYLHDATSVFCQHDYNYFYLPGGGIDYVSDVDYTNYHVPTYNEVLNGLYYDYWRLEYHRWIDYAKWFGIISFVVTLPVFKQLFTKQISLPKKS